MNRLILVLLPLVTIACTNASKLDLSSVGSRAMWQRPDEIVRALDLGPGDVVADLGAGEGYLVSYIAAAVGPDGVVYAVEVDPEVVPDLEETISDQKLENVKVVLGEYEDPKLPDGEVDVILLVNSYHHIEDREEYFRSLQQDLAPGGRVAVIEPNEDLSGVLSLFLDEGHTSRAPEVRAEMVEAGYRNAASHEVLPVQVFEVFEVEPASAP